MSILKTLTVNGTTYNVTPVVPATTVTLLASAWVGDGDTYSQVVEIPGVTVHTKVDLQPTAEQLAEFHHKVLAFTAENDGGTVTVYAIGDKPSEDHTIQVTKTEVGGTGKIRGNTVGTTMPRPDWNQDDPSKADYIRNKPNLNVPVFDLVAMGLSVVPMPTGYQALGIDTSEIRTALDKGPVALIVPFEVNGQTVHTIIRIAGVSGDSWYQHFSITAFGETAVVCVTITENSISVGSMPAGEMVGLPTITEEDNGKFLCVSNGEFGFANAPDGGSAETPVFDFGALGLTAVPLTGGSSAIETDTTEICAALDKGAVIFVIPFDAYGNTMSATMTMIGANANGSYQCISVVNMIEPGTVTVNVTDTGVQVISASLEPVPTSIDLSAYESEGKIVETFADGSTETTVMEFNSDGKPTKITDSNGNVTTLTW